jgi:macrodomain Ter protein organizer (MatP/YcbG family)
MKVKTSISLDYRRQNQLRELAKKEGRSVSQLIERLLDVVLESKNAGPLESLNQK